MGMGFILVLDDVDLRELVDAASKGIDGERSVEKTMAARLSYPELRQQFNQLIAQLDT